MKKSIFRSVVLLVFAWMGIAVQAQIPSGYYDSASGHTGAELKSALHDIIKGHTVVSYSGLLNAYAYTDCRANGTIWDIYSNCAYSINGSCGSYKKEGDCWNREHTWPQSWFNEVGGPKSDLFHVYPTDGYVNGRRSNYPYGEVRNPTYTSGNGSKLGPCTTAGFSGTAFEPIDEYKGDIARSYFYMSVRYFHEDSGWGNSEMTTKSEIKPWAMAMLLRWNEEDPVSDKEIARNNVIYKKYQHNRNPFIDHPEYARMIWDETWTAGEEYDIALDVVSHGSVSAPASAAAGTTVAITVIPDEGYDLETLIVYKTGDPSITVPVNSDATFVMPEYDVTVSATFLEDNTFYAITLENVVNGRIAASAQSAKVGTPVELTATPDNGYALYNWYVTKADGSQASVAVTDNTFVMPACDVTVTATFVAATAGNGDYVKVTSAPEDWSGEYLIVYEDGKKAFNGGLTTLDATSNNISVTISDDKIESNSTTDAATFTIAKSGNGYTICSASGYYIGQTGDANGLNSSKSTAYANTISLSGGVDIVSSGGAHLRYNASSDQERFRYYKSSSYNAQKAIQLYKKTATSAAVVPTYTITFNPNGGVGEVHTQTVEENIPTNLEANTFSYESHVFTGWNTKDDGAGMYYADEATVCLHDDLTLYAQWEMLYNIAVSENEHGSISVSTLSATEGTTVTLSAVPDEGYTLYLWNVTDVDGVPVQVFDDQFDMPACDVNVSATFVYVGQSGDSIVYRLVTSTDQLTAGDICLIANKSAAKALGSANNNNRAAASVTMNDAKDVITDRGEAYELVLGGSEGKWTFYDDVNQGYLYAASSSNNYLRTESTLSANSQWSVAVTNEGVATIKAQGSNTRNLLKYNSQNSIFSCYGSGQNDVSLFVRGNEVNICVILSDDDRGMDEEHTNTALINAYDNEKVNVVLYGHTFHKDGNWNTLVLPFSLGSLVGTPLDGASVKELTSASYENGTMTLTFSDDLDAIEAGKPYIVRWEGAGEVSDPLFNGVVISNDGPVNVNKGVLTMMGVYTPLRIEGGKPILFLGENNTLCNPDGEQTTKINAFHAYFQVNSSQGDVNGDGEVNVTDVTSLVNHILGNDNSAFIIDNADITGDEDITITDVTALVNLILHGSSKISNVVVIGADDFTFGGAGNGIAFSRAYVK